MASMVVMDVVVKKKIVMNFNAVVCVNSWCGRQEYSCQVIGETPKKYRIESDYPMMNG